MKKIFSIIGVIACISFTNAQTNLDFESGSFTGWTGRVGNTSTTGVMTAVGSPTIWTKGVNSNIYVQSYHTIMTGAGTDPFGGFPVVAPGGSYSARIGNMGTNVNTTGDSPADCSGISPAYYCPGTDFINGPVPAPFSGAESLEQTFTVTAANAMITLQYAAVFNNGSHSGGATVNPFFRAEVLDAGTGNPISSCLTYTFVLNKTALPAGAAKSGSSPCWYPAPATSSVVVYMPWQKKVFDLSAYIGTAVTVKFSAGGCDEGGHFGYAYVDASAGPKDLLQTGGSGCTGPFTLTGPTQYGSTYSWSGPPGGITASSANSATVNASGTYTMTINNGSCPITFTKTVTIGSASITAIPSNQTVCSGGSVSAINFTATPSGATIDWVNNNTGIGISASGSGNISGYTAPTVGSQQIGVITMTPSFGGCTGPAKSFTITVNPYPNLTTGSNPTITCTSSSAVLTGSSSTSGTTYSWTPGGSAPTSTATSVSAAGNYTVTASVGSCATSSVISVSSNTNAPDVSANATGTISCAVTTATLDGSSGTSGANYSWSPGGSTPTNSTTVVSGAGLYSLTVTDPSNGCQKTVTLTVSQNTTTPSVSTSTTNLTCSTTTAQAIATTTTSPASYNWNGPGIVSGNGTSTVVVNAGGTYNYTVTDSNNGCSKTGNLSITQNTLSPSVTVTPSSTLTCSNTTVQIVATTTTSPATFTWSGSGIVSGSNSSTLTVNNNGIYIYTVTGTGNGCSTTGTVSVSQNTIAPTFTLSPSSFSTTCSTPTVQVNANGSSGSLTYSWTPPSTGSLNNNSISNPIANGAGIFTVTATDPSNGCTSAISTMTIYADVNTPTVSLSANSVTLDCSNTTQTVSATSSMSDLTYSWSPSPSSGQGTSMATFDTPGSYQVVITNTINGCSSNANISVTQNTINPDVSSNVSGTLTCSNTSGTIDLYTTATPVSYSWTGPGIVSGNGTPTITIDAGGAYEYTVTNTSTGCNSTGTVSVSQNTVVPTLTLTQNSYTTTCANPTVQISVNGSSGSLTYTWTSPATGSLDNSNISNPIANGSGIFTVSATDPSNGCISAVSSVTVIPDANTPTVALSATDVTLTCTSLTQSITASSTQTDLTYSWTPAPSSGQGTSTPIFDTPGSYVGTIINTVNGCTSNATITVSSNTTQPVFGSINTNASSGSTITCNNAVLSYTAIGTAGSNITWTGPSGPLSGNPVNISSPGDYTITAVDPINGCSNDSIITISSNTLSPTISSITSSADSLNCANPTVSFSSASTNTNVTYSWNGPGSYTSNNPNPSGINVPGTYTLTVTDPVNGCTKTDSLIITQGTNPVVSFTANPTSGYAPLPVTFTNTSTGGFNGFSWTFGNGQSSTQTNTNTNYNTPGTYTVVLVGIASNNNCNDTASVVITVLENESIEIPNVFTPNGDGTNDFFYIHTKGYSDLKVEIYNRWGQLLHVMEGLHSSWDGKAPNKENVPDGVYYFLLTAYKNSGEQVTKTGFITLLR